MLALVWYAGAARRTARPVAALSPLAYLRDWYTLRVGGFSTPSRTGVELPGLPLEEHAFMLAVPALVVGTHEPRGPLARRPSRTELYRFPCYTVSIEGNY